MSSTLTSEPEAAQEEPEKTKDPMFEAAIAHSDDGNNPPSFSQSEEEQVEQIRAAADFNPDWRFKMAFVSLAILTLMVALDATSISVALPIMALKLSGTAIEAFWAGTSFLLTSTVFQPVVGSFSHIFGRKPLVLISMVLFGVGAIVTAVANNFDVILTGRSLQGIGGGGIIVLTEIIVTDMVPMRLRGKWFSFLSSMWSVGTVAGPLLGGGFAQNVTWRWIFWINLPFLGLGAFFIVAFLSLAFRVSSFSQKLRRVDWAGLVLFIASTTGFLIPVTWGGITYAWDSWRTLVPLILCAVGLITFVIHEEFWATEPLIRTSVFKNRTAAVTYLQTFLHGIILWCVLYYLPLYYEAVKGYSPIVAGIALFPQCFTTAPAAVAVGIAVAITGRFRWSIWIGWGILTLGCGLLVLLHVDTSIPAWIFLNLPSGLGAGMLFPSMAMAVQAAATSADQGYAATMYAFFRSSGQAVGVAIGGVIFQNQVRKRLMTYPLLAASAEAYSRDASGLVQIIKAMPNGSPQKYQLQEAYTWALKYVWIVLCVLGGIALVSSFWVEGLPLDRALETEQGFKDKKRAATQETDKEVGGQMQQV
ncbi:MAG: hypothetical protein M1821_001483 [Bathelium mastoideum]|nr:MAG: hypothetical protein M1821_001483 [Bathelium mastoideum]KAI9690012.1 MAG: hypothetical protein M1822_009894 [Bathelium mastoideum]